MTMPVTKDPDEDDPHTWECVSDEGGGVYWCLECGAIKRDFGRILTLPTLIESGELECGT